MEITDFSYIKIDMSYDTLLKNVEATYLCNGKADTLSHVKSVAKTNVRIADMYGLDAQKCHLSGLIHDISAVMNPNDMLDYFTYHNIALDESERRYPFLLHQQISRIFAQSIFKITDKDVLSAIDCHTTLKNNPTGYDMALFIADKLSWDQEGTPPFFNEVNAALSVSLEASCLSYINYMLSNNLLLCPHQRLLDAEKYLKKYVTE